MFKQFNPGELLPARAEKIASGPYDSPSFTVSMARKDARLMLEEAARHNIPLGVISAVAKLCDEAIARGEGGRDTTCWVPLSRRLTAGVGKRPTSSTASNAG